MENTSTALIIAASILIAMLISGILVYAFKTVSNFAQKQVTEEEISKIFEFNQPFLELESKATHDYSGKAKPVTVGATAEDVISIINYTNHLNKTSAYKVDFTLILNGKKIKGEEFNSAKQQEFIEQDLQEREKEIDNPRLRYHCKLTFNEKDMAPRVNSVVVKIYDRD